MKKFLVVILQVFCFLNAMAQESNGWKGYFSFNTIKDVVYGNQKIFMASENALFVKNTNDNQTKTFTTVDGLSGDQITKIHFSSQFNKTVIGHENGLIILLNNTDNTVFYLTGILDKGTIPNQKKKINHFEEFNGKVYISTDYGITVLDLATSQFGDSFFIGTNGSQVEVFQTAVFNNKIYAVVNGLGLLSAEVTNPFLVDYNQWTMAQAGNWMAIETTANKIAIISVLGEMLEYIPSVGANGYFPLPQVPKDLKYLNGKLTITTPENLLFFDDNLNLVKSTNNGFNPSIRFSSALALDEKIYFGTQADGGFQSSYQNINDAVIISPSGPFKNRIFGIDTYENGFWATYGDYTISYNPYPLDTFPISKYDHQNGWKLFPYENLFGAKSIARPLVNPFKPKETYFASYYSGLLKFENDVPITLYNVSNSTLQSIPGQVPNDIRVNGINFDKSGNLYVTNSLVSKNLHVLKTNGQWEGYEIAAISNPGPGGSTPSRIEVDRNGTVWMASHRNGVVGFNPAKNKSSSLKAESTNGNLPSINVRTIAIDKTNKLWIGTILGLRVLPSVDAFLTQDQLKANQVIILENEVAQELLYQQFITDIVVDGANNKWIGTAGSGVYYIADDGQKTFYHFTKNNSPLPNDNIIDIDINETTGEVFFATEAGLVSFKGNATSGAEDLKNVVIYPNPVRPSFKGEVAITGLMDKCNVKITDVAGNLVFEASAEGGTIMWDTSIFGKKKVASGVYLVHISSEDGLKTEVKKIMVIR